MLIKSGVVLAMVYLEIICAAFPYNKERLAGVY